MALVGRMLVDADDVGEAALLQPRNEILPDQACRAGDDDAAARDAALLSGVGQSLVRKKIGRGKSRMTS